MPATGRGTDIACFSWASGARPQRLTHRTGCHCRARSRRRAADGRHAPEQHLHLPAAAAQHAWPYLWRLPHAACIRTGVCDRAHVCRHAAALPASRQGAPPPPPSPPCATAPCEVTCAYSSATPVDTRVWTRVLQSSRPDCPRVAYTLHPPPTCYQPIRI